MSMEYKERVRCFDVLRVAATFTVMILHVAANRWYSTEVTSYAWNVFNVYDSLVRWSVPIFVMISGALFLNSNSSIKKIFSKNILRIVTAFLFWSILYVIIQQVLYTPVGKKEAIFNIIRGHYHLWFLYMIVGLYLIVPFLQQLVKNKMLTKYFLVLAGLFAFVIPQGIKLMDHSKISYINDVASVASEVINDVNFYFGMGYVFYFVAGAYLFKTDMPKIFRKVIYALGILGVLITIFFSAKWSIEAGAPNGLWYGYLTVNVMMTSVAIFVFAKYNLNMQRMSEGIKKFVNKLSKYSFGAYLAHVIFINILVKNLEFTTNSFNPAFAVPVIGIIVAVCSFGASALINQIPILKKYIV